MGWIMPKNNRLPSAVRRSFGGSRRFATAAVIALVLGAGGAGGTAGAVLRQMGAEDTLAFEDAAFASFNKRVAEFKEPGRGFQYS